MKHYLFILLDLLRGAHMIINYLKNIQKKLIMKIKKYLILLINVLKRKENVILNIIRKIEKRLVRGLLFHMI